MKKHIERARRGLGELNELSDRTQAAERRILEQAQRRHAEVSAAIERARPGIEGAPDAAQDRYTELVKERGQLEQVIAKSRAALQ